MRIRPKRRTTGGEGRSAEQGERRLSRLANWATILAAVTGVIALVIAWLALRNEFASGHGTKRASRIEAVSVQVPDPSADSERSEVQIILHNVGNERTIIKRAVIRILHAAQVHLCFSQGGIGLSGNYDVTLPDSPAPGQIVEVPLHQQLAGDEAERFALSFRAEPSATAEGPTIHLYQLELSLLHDESDTPVRLGKVLLALPLSPESDEYYWASELESPSTRAQLVSSWGAGYYSKLMPCWRSNSLVLHHFLALDGERSPSLAKAASTVVVPSPQLVRREHVSCEQGLARRKQQAREAEAAMLAGEAEEAEEPQTGHPFDLVC
jgi:hypothetical protein